MLCSCGVVQIPKCSLQTTPLRLSKEHLEQSLPLSADDGEGMKESANGSAQPTTAAPQPMCAKDAAPTMPLISLLKNIPGDRAKVVVGTFLLFAIAGSPLAYKEFNKNSEQRKGHDLFSQEKPQAILDSEDQRRKEYKAKQQQQQGH